MFYKKAYFIILFIACVNELPLNARDIIVEFKAAYFLPTNHTFKNIYNGNAIYGPEATIELSGPLYAFAAVDFFNAHGHSIGECTPTHVGILNIEAGLKYLLPIPHHTACCKTDLYVGVGILPTRLHTHDDSPYVIQNRTKWNCGGIVKIGAYITINEHYVIDLFYNYSCAKISFNCWHSTIQSHDARTNGCWFGAGLGYRFN